MSQEKGQRDTSRATPEETQAEARREFLEEFSDFRQDFVLPAVEATGASCEEVLLFHIFFQLETLVQDGVQMKATVVHVSPPPIDPPEGEEWKK